MSPLQAHVLGAVNLLDGTKYLPTHEGEQGWDPDFKAGIVALGAGDGARLGSARIVAVKRGFQLICLGADYATARANADAVDAELIKARNWPRTWAVVLYQEQDTSDVDPDTYKVLTGVYKRTNELRPSGLVIGVVTLHLSKV